MSNIFRELPITNHYGLPYSEEERDFHASLMPIEPRPINEPRSVATFALQNGIEALFLA